MALPAAEALLRHAWPGNVRELFNVIEHAHVLSDGPLIQMSDLPVPLSTGGFREHASSDLNLEGVEPPHDYRSPSRCNYNRTAACNLLGLELRRLNRRIASLKIEMPSKANRVDVAIRDSVAIPASAKSQDSTLIS